MALRHLQLFRNSGTTLNRSEAKALADNQKGGLYDGDVIAARYVSSGNVQSVAVGHKVGSVLVWNDPEEIKEMVSASTASTENLEKAVGVAHNASAITFDNGVTYISSGSAKDALEDLDAALKTTDDLAKQVQAAVGSSASTLNIEGGKYVASSDTVKQAVTKLDTNLYTVSGTADNVTSAFTKYTSDVVGAASGSTGLGVSGTNVTSGMTVKQAVDALDKAIESGDTANDNLRKAVGAAEGASTMAFTGANYISAATANTVSGALVTLDSNLYTVSGKANSALTLVGNAEQVLGVGTGATTLGVSGHYVTTADTVSGAVKTLDTKLQEVSASSTTDVDNLRKAVGAAAGSSSMTFDNAHYIANDKTVSGALMTLDSNLDSLSGVVTGHISTYNTYTAATNANTADTRTMAERLDSVVGVTSGDSTFVTTGSITSQETTVKGAVEALNTAITGSTDNLEKLAQAVGVATGTSSMSFPSSDAYISGQTTVSGALDSLNDSLTTVSGDLDTLESAYSGYSATTDNAINGLAKALGIISGTSAMTFSNTNYLNGQTSASGALVTLDTVEKATRDTIGGMNVDGTSGLTLTGQHYISGDKTVVSALTDLDTSLYELSGSVSANKIVATNTIAVTTAESGTSLDVKISSTATEPSTSASEEVMHGNIISATTDGLVAFADIHYSAAENTLEFVNTYGKRRIPLTGVKVFDNVTYDSTTEKIILSYTDLSGGTKTVEIPVSGIIEEFQFNGSDQSGATPASSGQHNVSLVGTHVVNGATQVYGELSVFDCGEY